MNLFKFKHLNRFKQTLNPKPKTQNPKTPKPKKTFFL